MKVENLCIEGVLTIEPQYYEDYRGYYVESYSARTLHEYNIDNSFVQDNHLLTIRAGTLRGIHFQNNPKAQAKLVRCIRGSLLDVAVDLRKNSPSYRQWVSVILSADNRKQLFIPCGFGHACLTLTDNCEFQYKVDQFYEPSLDRAIAWNDPDINIIWPIERPIISQKDISAPLLRNSDINF